MGTIEVIKKFIESNWIIERAVREVLERLPLRFRYGISYGPSFRYWLGFLRESEKWDRDRLEAYQFEQLKDLLIHAGKNVPYYRKVFREYGFKPEKVQSLEDIKVLPYLDRTAIKGRHHEFISENIPEGKLIAATTIGTSGIPLVLYGTKETEERHWATIVNLWGRIGYTPKSRTVFFEANIRRGDRDNLPWNKYGNTLILSSNYFLNEWIEKYIEMLNNFRPEYLIGFSHTIAAFSTYIMNIGKPIFDGLKGVIVYAENVYKWQREIIKEVFGVRVFSDYGMVEKVIHGGECEHSYSCHLYPQYGFTEYLRLQDSMYELVGTGFINYAMPLIRYRTGDVCAEIETECPDCRRNYDVIHALEGRISDFLIDSDGQVISVHLNMDFSVFENIKRFQLYQECPGEVDLRIWFEDSYPDSYKDEDTNKILSEVNRSLGLHGDRIKFAVVSIDGIQPPSSEKHRMVDQQLDIKDFLNH